MDILYVFRCGIRRVWAITDPKDASKLPVDACKAGWIFHHTTRLDRLPDLEKVLADIKRQGYHLTHNKAPLPPERFTREKGN